MSTGYTPPWMQNRLAGKSTKEKSMAQEAKSARDLLGQTTYGSGALPFDKADVRVQNHAKQFEPVTLRVECKRTDKGGIYLEADWLRKLKRDLNNQEFWALELEIQDQQAVVISKGDFRFLAWILTTPAEEVIKHFQDGFREAQ